MAPGKGNTMPLPNEHKYYLTNELLYETLPQLKTDLFKATIIIE